MRRFLFALLILDLVSSMVAKSQTSCPKAPPYALLRQDENYSYLHNPACRNDFWDPIKYMPLNANGDRYLTLGGEIREWYEGFQNANWGEGPQDGNGYLLQRISLYSDWNLGERVRLFGQLTSAIEAGRNGGPRPTDEAKLWVEEGFADIKVMKSDDASLDIRVGRQEFEFGSGRLVDAREGPNVRQAFDGVDLILNAASWHVDGFATRPVLNNVGVFDDPPSHSTKFWGVYAVRPLPATKGGNIDLYYLGIDNKEATFQRGTAQEIRHTVGTRFWGNRGPLDYNLEALFQWGSFGNAGIRAWSVTPGASYSLRSLPLNPQLEIRFIATSGDQNPDTGGLGTFNPLFPTAIYFGQGVVNLNGPSNLIGVRPAAKLQVAKTVLLAVDYDFAWRKSLQDGVYGLGVNLLRSGLENQSRFIGSQPSIGIYWQVDRHVSLSAAYTHFFAGPFLTESASPGRDVNYAVIEASYKF
jgi:Alginate export